MDIKIRWDNSLIEGDFLFENNDLVTDEGLGTAVLISLFTDQRASDDDIIPNISEDFIDRKGWWGDLVDQITIGDQIGSKLWLLNRSKTNIENPAFAIEYSKYALQWMIDDGIVRNIDIISERVEYNHDFILALQVQIIKLDGTKLNINFDPEWFATFDPDYS